MDCHYITVNLLFYSCLVLSNVFSNEVEQKHEIVNPHPFEYILNNEDLCANKPDILIWIHTAPGHYRRRTFLRQTWGNPYNFRKRKARIVFFLGATNNAKRQKAIKYESENFRDIVQETFIDSYRNLTLKAIAGSKWISTFCKSAKIIIKTDDDIVVDVYMLFRHIDSLQTIGKMVFNTILGDVWFKRRPERKAGKWNVSLSEYDEAFYPPYCPGLGSVITGDLMPKLYEASFYQKYFWIEDVYLTGLLARAVNATFEQVSSTVHFGSSRVIRDQTNFQHEDHFIFYHIYEPPIANMVWNMIYRRELARIKRGITPSA